jgi:acyl carrier protein
MNDTEQWLVRHFEANDPGNGAIGPELLDVNYFDHELLDSFGVVQLILGIEDELGVRLEPEQMQDPRFCTIRGLAEIIDEQKAA